MLKKKKIGKKIRPGSFQIQLHDNYSKALHYIWFKWILLFSIDELCFFCIFRTWTVKGHPRKELDTAAARQWDWRTLLFPMMFEEVRNFRIMCRSSSLQWHWHCGNPNHMNQMLDTSPLPFCPPPISKFANSKFTIVIGHALALNPNRKDLSPNPKY